MIISLGICGDGVLESPCIERQVRQLVVPGTPLVIGRRQHQRLVAPQCLQHISRDHFQISLEDGECVLTSLAMNPLWRLRDGEEDLKLEKSEKGNLRSADRIALGTPPGTGGILWATSCSTSSAPQAAAPAATPSAPSTPTAGEAASSASAPSVPSAGPAAFSSSLSPGKRVLGASPVQQERGPKRTLHDHFGSGAVGRLSSDESIIGPDPDERESESGCIEKTWWDIDNFR